MTKEEKELLNREEASELGVKITEMVKEKGDLISATFIALRVGDDLVVCANGNMGNIVQTVMQALYNTVHDVPNAVTLSGYRRQATPEERFELDGGDADARGH